MVPVSGLTADVEILNLDTMSWSKGPEMPEAIAHASAEVYDDNLLVIGGKKLGL